MQIYIKTLSNTISLQVDPTYSISKLKKILHDRERIPITEQRLLFSGKQLEDKKTVGYYAIQQDSSLDLLLRLRGGRNDLTITFDNNITLTISSSGELIAQVTGAYTFGPPTVNNFVLKNQLNSTTSETVPGIRGSYEDGGGSTFTITFTATVTEYSFASYYKQLMRYAFYIETVTVAVPAQTSTVEKYFFIPNSTTNILMTGSNFKSITAVDISSEYKSVMLPPITTEKARGTILHFKVTACNSPYIFQIIPYIQGGAPAGYTLYDALPVFDSTIDLNTAPPIPTTALLYLDTVNMVISLISDGIEWRILNYYDGSLVIDLYYSINVLPYSRVEITSQNIVLYYTNTVTNICIFPSTVSYYLIRYLTISNSTGDNTTYTIFFPNAVNLDNKPTGGTAYCTISFTLGANSINSIMFTSTPSGYLILGRTTYPALTVDNTARDTTDYPLLSKNITCALAINAGNPVDCEIPVASTLAIGTSKLCILKGRRSSVPDLKTNIYTPHSDPSSTIIFNGNANTKISFDQTLQGALWFSVYYNETTHILPINYYTGGGPTFVSYPDLTGGGGGGGGGGGPE